MALGTAGAARRRRAPLMALAVVALCAGLWGGLILLGLSLPSAVTSAAQLHGPLMALGFLGTLVSLERAVALGRSWAYAAPLAAGAGVLAALAGTPDSLGPALLTLAGFVLLSAHAVLHRLQPSAHNAVMGQVRGQHGPIRQHRHPGRIGKFLGKRPHMRKRVDLRHRSNAYQYRYVP